MSLLGSLSDGFRALFGRQRVEREMDEELHAYLDTAVKEKMRSGMTPEEALRAARVDIGGMEAVKEGI